MEKRENNDMDKKAVEDDVKKLMDKRVKELLECNPEKIKKEIFYMKLDQAKLGMVYIKDREIMKRISSGQMIRMISFISTDIDERKKYIEASMPEVSVIKQIEGK